MICYIFSTNKVFEIRLVVIIPLTTIPKFNWQLCLKLTDPNFAWFNSQSTKKVPTLGLAFSYLRTSILSVFYGTALDTPFTATLQTYWKVVLHFAKLFFADEKLKRRNKNISWNISFSHFHHWVGSEHRIQIEWTYLSKMMLSNFTLYSTKPFIIHPKIHETFHYLLEIYWKICSGFIFHCEMSLIILLNYTSCALL